MNERIGGWLRPWTDFRHKRFWLLIALLAWTLFGFFGAPPLVERALQEAIAQTGRTVEVADVRINPFTLSLAIDGLEVRDPDSTPIISFDELYVNLQLSSLFRWAWTFSEIRLNGLHIEEERFASDDTRLLRLVTDFSGTEEGAESPPAESTTPRLIIHSIVLENGSFAVTDHLAGDFNTRFGPISVSMLDLRTIPGPSGNQEVSIVTPDGGVIAWSGNLQLVPLDSSGHFTVHGRGLPVTLQYLDHFMPIAMEGEDLDVEFDYSLGSDAGNFSLGVDNWQTRSGGIQVRMDGSDETFLSLDRIDFKGGSGRWPEGGVTAESLSLEGLSVKAWLDEVGHLSLLDALPPANPEAATEAGSGTGPADWDYLVDKLALTNADVEFEDRRLPTPGPVHIEDLAVEVTGATNREGAEMSSSLSLGLASGGEASWSGRVSVLPEVKVDGQLHVNALALPVLQPWLEQQAHLELSSGNLGLDAELSGTAPAAFVIAGSASLDDLELLDSRRGERLAAVDGLSVERFDLDIAGNSLKTSPIGLNGAYGRVHIYQDLSTNLDSLAVGKESPAETSEARSLAITIAGIEVEDGALDFTDDSLPLPFNAEIRNMDGSVSALATGSAEPARVTLEGQVNEFGQARIEGTLNPWDFTDSADLAVDFRNLEMANLTPYTIQYAGYAIKAGRLDMDLGYTLQQRKLEGENNIVIRELKLGDKVEYPDAASLPLKLAVALLKDSEGVIDIDLPVSGDLDDPTFKISGIVWKAIGNLITKIVTSPFRLLGNLVGVDSEDFGTLSFRPGRADLSPPDRERLGKLAEAMQQRPELSLVVKGTYVEALDRPALQARAFQERLVAVRSELTESGAAGPLEAGRAALESLFAQTFPDVPLDSVKAEFLRPPPAAGEEPAADATTVLDEPAYLNALRQRQIDAEQIDEDRLRALGIERARAVAEALGPGDDTTGQAVTVSDEVESGEAEDDTVLMELEVAVQDA